jgi:hypothetical protein
MFIVTPGCTEVEHVGMIWEGSARPGDRYQPQLVCIAEMFISIITPLIDPISCDCFRWISDMSISWCCETPLCQEFVVCHSSLFAQHYPGFLALAVSGLNRKWS